MKVYNILVIRMEKEIKEQRNNHLDYSIGYNRGLVKGIIIGAFFTLAISMFILALVVIIWRIYNQV